MVSRLGSTTDLGIITALVADDLCTYITNVKNCRYRDFFSSLATRRRSIDSAVEAAIAHCQFQQRSCMNEDYASIVGTYSASLRTLKTRRSPHDPVVYAYLPNCFPRLL